ncbi:T-complex 10 C-terminal domain-containing protein [Hymenobacter radiodurans]|uniref:T-complex 10 C-terminal domain-containing protein n=1 Tax=Hymenobacter radiodurans TaxID=2496028 RepID=UPI001058E695|nr:T-complex 10 C-terminal domain-containing protein [Hymenobacter radiodurans]
MKSALFLLAGAAALSLAACNTDKKAAVDAATTPSADTAVVADNDVVMLYREQGNRVANRVTTDLGITDTAQVREVRRVYDTRATRLGEVDTRYAADTSGRTTALREIDRETDSKIKDIVKDDDRYMTYEEKRATYYTGEEYAAEAEDDKSTTTTAAAPAPARRQGPTIVKVEKKKNGESKTVYSDGRTVKVDKDGDRKTEYPNGTKVKRDADDGERKVKD